MNVQTGHAARGFPRQAVDIPELRRVRMCVQRIVEPAPRRMRRIAFVPGPSGFRFFRTHLTARTDLSLGLYSGEVGLVYIEPRRDAGAYDSEIFLTVKGFSPYLSHTEMPHDYFAELFRKGTRDPHNLGAYFVVVVECTRNAIERRGGDVGES